MQNKFWYKPRLHEQEVECYEILDTIDLEKMLNNMQGRQLCDLIEILEDKYKLSNSCYLFNCVSEYKFYEYINRRYDNNFVDERLAYFIL